MSKQEMIQQLEAVEKALSQSNERIFDIRNRLDALARHNEATRLHIHYLQDALRGAGK
ncbi:hypothetical protein [Gleimia coleocanis]|nr:hypothetical protein [Gleimia coleocanis]